MVLLTDLKL